MNSFRRADPHEGCGHAAVAEGIAGGQESFAAHLTPSPSPIRLERVATAKAITLRIPQLKDCKNHFAAKKEKGKSTMVFVCEGQSAAGSITSWRDPIRDLSAKLT